MKPTYNQLIAGCMLPAFLILLGLVYFIPSKNPSQEGAIIAVIIGGFTTCLHFLVGSSSGSQSKDDTITNLTTKN